MPPRTSKTPAAKAARRPRATARAAVSSPPRRKPAPRRPRAEQPLGVGVGDAFAVQRLQVPASQSRARPDERLREIGWAEFGDIARELAERMEPEFKPDVVLGVVNGGVFLGGAIASYFRAEFRPIRVRKYGRRSVAQAVMALRGKKVLVVDDVTVSGQTLGAGRVTAEKAGARDIRTAAMVVRPAGHHADFFALETEELVVFGWDYQLHGGSGEPGSDPGEVGV
ncbi:phosphoribosyltransferase [Anaeromyxobacter diazotrophicus]|uniref:Phosphoribosyltransferase domain-containing protein n=1 Tax=Anaeromyxobacter diazotrophicus TaxID=2590199 RepID=A0A7I9VPW9_9BACT|nr:phosphoribosyltransferase [Anaeromyxobacter diazotrophicus]GEJ58453.1 hypothetical protein AMYX_31940 [Anaeromyxobacter diazotrophicus]